MSISRVLSKYNHFVLVIYLVLLLPAGSSGLLTVILTGNQRLSAHGRPPCSRQGLPSSTVTSASCELLPHSFHPYSASGGAVSFLWHFP